MSAALAKLVERAEVRASETPFGGDAALIRDLVTVLKTERPGEAATSPSHVQTVQATGADMNIATHTTPRAIAATAADLIDAHLAAVGYSERLWTEVSEMEDIANLPVPAVIYSVSRVRNHQTGEEEQRPRYAFSLEALRSELARMHSTQLQIFGGHPVTRSRVIAEYEERRARGEADLKRQIAAHKRQEGKLGITKAKRAAEAASKAVNARLDAILGHDFASVHEVQEVASYLVESMDSIESVTSETIFAFVERLAAGWMQ